MKFLADESVDAPIVTLLRNNGYDVDYVSELFPSVDDEYVLSKADTDARILITQDKDFGELVYRLKKAHSGIILIRLEGIKPIKKAEIVLSVVNRYLTELLNSFTVIQKSALRIRKI